MGVRSLVDAGAGNQYRVMAQAQPLGEVVGGCGGKRQAGGEFAQGYQGLRGVGLYYEADGVQGLQFWQVLLQPGFGLLVVADQEQRHQAGSVQGAGRDFAGAEVFGCDRQKIGVFDRLSVGGGGYVDGRHGRGLTGPGLEVERLVVR